MKTVFSSFWVQLYSHNFFGFVVHKWNANRSNYTERIDRVELTYLESFAIIRYNVFIKMSILSTREFTGQLTGTLSCNIIWLKFVLVRYIS